MRFVKLSFKSPVSSDVTEYDINPDHVVALLGGGDALAERTLVYLTCSTGPWEAVGSIEEIRGIIEAASA